MNETMRTYGVTPQDQALSTDGLTFLKKLIDGTYPAPPIARIGPVSLVIARTRFTLTSSVV